MGISHARENGELGKGRYIQQPGDHTLFFDGDAFLEIDCGVGELWTSMFTNFSPL